MSIKLEEKISRAVRVGKLYNLDHFQQAWENPSLRRLMGNELLYPPSPRVFQAVRKALPTMHFYPEDPGTAEKLRNAIAEYLGINGGADWITLGNGSMEIIDMLPRTFLDAGDEALLPCPEYSPYSRRPLLYGGVIVDVLPSGEDFSYSLKDFTNRITTKTKMVFLSRPNAPVGNMVSIELLEALLDTDLIVVVDEAYAEFSRQSVCGLLNDHNNLVVSRTFSKAMGLGGIRLGAAAAQPELIEYIEHIRVPLNVSQLTQVAAMAALEDADHIRRNTETVIQTRDRFYELVDRIPGLKAYLSEGNFVLINCEESGIKAETFKKRLLDEGYLVRNLSGGRGLKGDYFFRVTIGRPEDMNEVLRIIEDKTGKVEKQNRRK